MKRLKEKILEDNQLTTPSPTDRSTPSTSSCTGNSMSSTPATSTNNTTVARLNDTYVYGVSILAVLVIGFCVFFTYNTSQAKNKKIVNKKQDEPPIRRHML